MPADPADQLGQVLDNMTGTSFATGVVTAYAAPKVTVTVRGGSKVLPKLLSYASPTAGDVVLIACMPGSWCVLGEIG